MTGSGFGHALRLWFLGVTPGSLVPLALVLAIVAPGAARADDNRAADLGECKQLQVPQGNKVAFHASGVGVQIYRWNGSSGTFVAPEAVLYANAGDDGVVGIHFGGPTWQSNSGSQVAGTVIDHCTPTPIPSPGCCLQLHPRRGPGFSRT